MEFCALMTASMVCTTPFLTESCMEISRALLLMLMDRRTSPGTLIVSESVDTVSGQSSMFMTG
jgi:hypothetical protein